MKLVHDPAHGYIELDEFARKLVDTPPEFQRLRRITQLGFAFLAYPPSARHTRFEHSLGTFHLAKKIRAHNPEIGGRSLIRGAPSRYRPLPVLAHP
ncbi:hypothetical protein [Thermococcus sp. JCM 11816]|uniref:hypothetical protein n=1 Tax=Thermococcus sp. (strain JCM 11816 / KS-1) TaxID=1295125 RepID=UPI000A7BBF8D